MVRFSPNTHIYNCETFKTAHPTNNKSQEPMSTSTPASTMVQAPLYLVCLPTPSSTFLKNKTPHHIVLKLTYIHQALQVSLSLSVPPRRSHALSGLAAPTLPKVSSRNPYPKDYRNPIEERCIYFYLVSERALGWWTYALDSFRSTWLLCKYNIIFEINGVWCHVCLSYWG